MPVDGHVSVRRRHAHGGLLEEHLRIVGKVFREESSGDHHETAVYVELRASLFLEVGHAIALDHEFPEARGGVYPGDRYGSAGTAVPLEELCDIDLS